jgi:tRNA-modifying protein YgfZ
MIPSGSYKLLNDRAFFKITGPDAERYLNGQVTQKVRAASTKHALATCVTNAKGKLQGVGFIRQIENGYMIDCPIEIREAMMERLDKYLIADDAELVDVTDETRLYHCIGEAESGPNDACVCNRLGIKGYDTSELPSGKAIEDSTWEAARIYFGVPAWGRELDENILPPEARLENSSISYDKGCYIGQEVISRMKSSGKVNRLLHAFKLSGELQVPAPIPSTSASGPDDKAAGILTSLAFFDNQWIALGYLNRKFFEENSFKIEDILINVC